MLILQIAIIVILLIIVYQDFKLRAISWWLIPLILVLSVSYVVIHGNGSEIIYNFLINSGIVLFELMLLTIYFSVKNRRLTNIVNKYIGIGDVLFFIPLCVFFSPLNFILFKISALFLTLIGFLGYMLITRKMDIKIPMAGTLSIALIGVIISSLCFSIDSLNDTYALNLLTGFYE